MFPTEITGYKSTDLWPVSSATTLRHCSRMALSMSVDRQGITQKRKTFPRPNTDKVAAASMRLKTHVRSDVSLSFTRCVDTVSLSQKYSCILWPRHLKQSTIFVVSGPSYSSCWWCLFGSSLAKLAALLGASTASDLSKACYLPFVHAMVMR